MRWHRLAAAQGDQESPDCLGYMFEHGQCVAKDRAEAIRWYRLAAENRDSQSDIADGANLALGR